MGGMLCVLYVYGPTAYAGLLSDLKPETEPWAEEDLKDNPRYPDANSLVPFSLSGATRYEYYLDSRSINIGKDGVVRFIVAIKPSSSALQLIYAGIRCQTKQWKSYAVGSQDPKWMPVQKPTWEDIVKTREENYRHDLFSHYVCAGNGPVGSAKQILANVRNPVRERFR